MQNARSPTGDYLPTAKWPNLRRRAELLRELREFFHGRGFLEVETPILSADVVVDRHLDPFSTVLADDPRHPEIGRRLWLQTSPEFGMKRLLAGRDDSVPQAIYQVSRVFRNAERGRLHNPEFTLVEWYRVGDDMAAGMMLLSDLAEALLRLGPAEQISYRDGFRRWVGVDPLIADAAELAAVAKERGVAAPTGLSLEDHDAWLELLFVELVQPNLACRPVIVYDYPASQAALAKVRPISSPAAGGSGAASTAVAERFELFVAGVELANGYHELLDPAELRRRSRQANAQRVADGKPPLPEDSRLVAAMEHGLPPCSGVALGFDRLVMVAVGAQSIGEVMAFPTDRA